MFTRTIISALSCALLFSTATTALPSRTHCRCSITSVDASLQNSDSLVPTTSSTTSSRADLCAALGPSLESLRHTNPALYESYISKADRKEVAAATEEERPLSTTVLLRLAAQHGFQNLGVVLPSAPAEREPSQERIECKAEGGEKEAWTAYQVSWVTLVVLQVVVAAMVVACVAEGIMMGMRWMSQSTPEVLVVIPARPSALRLDGEERRLLAVPSPVREDMRSPGAEKKMRAYASPGWKSARNSYMEDEDDEFNRPVM